MKTSVLTFINNEGGSWHAIFKTNHSRKLYLALSVSGDVCTVEECYYLDRSTKKIPKALTFEPFSRDMLAEKIAKELDKRFSEIRFLENVIPKKELISAYLGGEKKKILLLLKKGDYLRTIFKNNSHRTIFLEMKVEGDRGLIARCEYQDDRSSVMVFGLKTIYFDFSLHALLEIVNTELEGGFTDVAVTEEHTLILDRPICGRI